MDNSSPIESMSEEVDLFGPQYIQTIVEKEFDRMYLPGTALANQQPIEFTVKRANNLYLDLNDSYMVVRVKITNADGTNIGANTAGPVNLTLHSLFREIEVRLNTVVVTDINSLYPYRAYLETLVNYSDDTFKTRMLSENWVKDTTGHMAVTEVGGNNAGLNSRTTPFALSHEVELVGRPHLDIFHQNRLIPPGFDLDIKLHPSSNAFVCKSAAPANNAQQQAFKAAIQQVKFFIRTKQLKKEAELAHRELILKQPVKLLCSKVQVKHLSIPPNQTNISFDNVFTGTLPDLVIIGLVDDRDFAGHYNRNPFNFQPFGVNRMELVRDDTRIPSYAYTPDFANTCIYERVHDFSV